MVSEQGFPSVVRKERARGDGGPEVATAEAGGPARHDADVRPGAGARRVARVASRRGGSYGVATTCLLAHVAVSRSRRPALGQWRGRRGRQPVRRRAHQSAGAPFPFRVAPFDQLFLRKFEMCPKISKNESCS
jgi:hypothetical protein